MARYVRANTKEEANQIERVKKRRVYCKNWLIRACGKLHKNFYNLCAICHLQFPGHGCIL